MKKLRGYIFARPFMGERAPQHVQNIVLRDYCTKRGHELLLAATEYAMPDSFMILESLLDDLLNIDGIAFYSLFQLPENEEHREHIYQHLIQQNKSLHFAVEGLSANTEHGFERIETLWRIRQTLPNCATFDA
jgi:sporadic carbohydrate cluster protein (TIGR04323 family)